MDEHIRVGATDGLYLLVQVQHALIPQKDAIFS